MVEKEIVLGILNQLDEPEVLSSDWIGKNVEYAYFDMLDGSGRLSSATAIIRPKKLQNLLVPEQEITFEQAHDKLREESILSERSFDYYWNCINDNVEIDEPGNLLVPKQEEVDRAYKDGYEKGKQHTFYKGYLEGLAEGERKTAEYFESITEEPSYAQVQKYLSEHGIKIADKEPETVADVVTTFWKSYERLKEVMSMEVEELEE